MKEDYQREMQNALIDMEQEYKDKYRKCFRKGERIITYFDNCILISIYLDAGTHEDVDMVHVFRKKQKIRIKTDDKILMIPRRLDFFDHV